MNGFSGQQRRRMAPLQEFGVIGRVAREKIDRMLLEWCCGEDLLLGMPSVYADGCNVVRLTQREGMTTRSGVDFAKAAVERCPPNMLIAV